MIWRGGGLGAVGSVVWQPMGTYVGRAWDANKRWRALVLQ